MVTFTKEQLISTTPQERREFLRRQQPTTYQEPVEVVTGPTEEEIAKYEEQQRLIEEYNQKIASYNKEVEEWKLAERFVRDRPNMIGFLPASIQTKARELQKQGVESWDQIKSARNYQVLINEYKQKLEAEKLATAPRDTGFYLDVGTGKTYAKPETKAGPFVEAPEVLQAQLPVGEVYKPEAPPTKYPSNIIIPNTVELPDQAKQSEKTAGVTFLETVLTPTLGLETLRSKISYKKQIYGDSSKLDISTKGGFIKSAKLTGLGFGAGAIDLVLATASPIQTTKSVFKLITDKEYRSSVGAQIGSSLYYDPQFSVGYALGTESTGIGVQTITKPITSRIVTIPIDFFRNIKAEKLSQESRIIIAPEYFAGQKYPKIKPGQTAGELLKEFFGPKLPGEVEGTRGMFTASPSSFKKNTITLPGYSELPGFYGAPYVSPTFLKLTDPGYSYGLGLNPFSGMTLYPTIVRSIVKDIKLIPGLKPTQRTLTPYNKALDFFENVPTESGYLENIPEAFVPFIKTEKEAIIPAGTLISRKDLLANFYIEFEGRKVPIYTYKPIGTGGKKLGLFEKPTTFEELSSRYYSQQPGYSRTPYRYSSVLPERYSYVSPTISRSSLASYDRKDYQIVAPSYVYYPEKSQINLDYSYRTPISSSYINPPGRSYTPTPGRSYTPTPSRSYLSTTYKSPPYRTPPYYPPRRIQEGYDSRKYYGLSPSQVQAFRVFTKRYGKVIELARGLPRGKALLTGARYTKRTLGASFKIEPFGTTTTPDIRFTPDQEFRTYRVSRGRRIPLTDEFIQRRKFRLSSIPERREILQAKRSKRRLTWL